LPADAKADLRKLLAGREGIGVGAFDADTDAAGAVTGAGTRAGAGSDGAVTSRIAVGAAMGLDFRVLVVVIFKF
jgi:hypothetical protein